MGIFAIRSEGNNVTNRIVGSNGVRNVRNERPFFVKGIIWGYYLPHQDDPVFQVSSIKLNEMNPDYAIVKFAEPSGLGALRRTRGLSVQQIRRNRHPSLNLSSGL
jgi:hypothetical protein